ncbi:MAG: YtxH domain-containing protein [Oscillospiraceae bacterium]|nr:YtxH domain-containing protein [Oscillospiraceae bacterium]
MMCGKFCWGMVAGLAVGTVIGMTLAPAKRDMRRAAHKAVKSVNCAVNEAIDGINCVVENFNNAMGR